VDLLYELVVRMSRVGGIFMEKNIGEIIKSLRKDAKLTQGELAARAGITRRALQYIESGDKPPSYHTLERIEAALGPSQ